MSVMTEEENKMEKDILFQIDMQLYDEFNDTIATMNDHLGDIYSLRDVEEVEKAEKDKEIKLLREAVKKLQADIEIKDKVIDDLCFAITHEEIPQEFYCHSTSINCEMVGGTMECKECLKQAVYEEVEKVEEEKC